jgi:hypothetical protein
MTLSEEVRRRRHSEMAECFAVVETCLACYYGGAKHMYRPLAGQLRILFCDKRPLLGRVFPDLKIPAVRKIEWSVPDQATLFGGTNVLLTVQHPPGQEFRLARMPFLITEYENGLQSADLEFDQDGQLLPLDDWLNQLVTVYPSDLSLREVMRSVADKGGGAHVDDTANKALHDMSVTGPAGVGVHVLFSIALGRFAQKIGLHYIQFRERFGYRGRLQDLTFDPQHPTVEACAKVLPELEEGPRKQFALTSLKRIR